MSDTLHRPSAIDVLARKIIDLEHMTPKVREPERARLRGEITRLRRRVHWLRWLERRGLI